MSSSRHRTKRSSEHPYLVGNFSPVIETHSLTPCTYSGDIPPELTGGQYVRNGGNPVSNADLGRDAHWFDGDGMLAGVLFQRSPSSSDKVVPRFVNQYILTDVCRSNFENEILRTPILPSIATLINPFSSVLVILREIFRSMLLVVLSHLPGSEQAIKRISVANTGVLFHDGRALATCESGPPIRIQLPGLETVGWFDGRDVDGEPDAHQHPEKGNEVFGGTGLLGFIKEWTTGHPKVDPATGEMILFHCNFAPPYVHYSVIPSSSQQPSDQFARQLLNAPVPQCSGGKMMHDFGVSLTHTVILDLPLTLSPFNLLRNKPIVSYDCKQPSRFGIFPRHDPSRARWYETKGCCIFHTANTWDEYGSSDNPVAINVLACRLTSASLVFSAGNLAPPRMVEDPIGHCPRPFVARFDDGEGSTGVEKVLSDEKTPFLGEAGGFFKRASPSSEDDDEEQCRLYYYRFSLEADANIITHQYALSSIPFEFPTLNPAKEMRYARYIYGCSTSNESFGAALGRATKIDILVKIDVHTLLARGIRCPPQRITACMDYRPISKVLASHDPHDPIQAFRMPRGWFAQEARFVSRKSPVSEDDGYLLFYAFDESQLDRDGMCPPGAVSELWILNAKSMTDLVANVRLPQRVPYGLHGNWFPESQILHQREVGKTRTIPRKQEWTNWRRMKRLLVKRLG